MVEEEKGCCWNFAEFKGGREIGPNDSSVQNFKESPYNSLIRESIQNSLDVVHDQDKPVKIDISFKTLLRGCFPRFFDLKDHIKGCLEYYPDNANAEKVYGSMLSYLKECSAYGSLEYICISDTNTKGMDYVEGDTNCPFYAFVRSIGVSAKSSVSAGGSYGFGKAAYFNISPISTVLVSTMTDEGKFFFEGASCLCTHRYQGSIMVDFGFYDSNGGMPVGSFEDIPAQFRRHEPGTSINIMGIKISGQKEAIKDEMVAAVLKNFWYAIYGGKLEVYIDGKEISRNTLDRLMSFYFPDIEDNVNGMGRFSPRPYYEAVHLHDMSPEDRKCMYFSEMSVILGSMHLYCLLDKTAKKDRVIYLRKPRMLVFRKTQPSNYGVYAMFLCEDDKGNGLLRSTENPAHDKWEISNCCSDEEKKNAKAALNEIDRFIKDSFKKISDTGGKQVLAIAGLEEYLYSLPENLIEEDSLVQESGSPYLPDGKMLETVSISVSVQEPAKLKERSEDIVGSILVKKPGRTVGDDNSSYMAGHGHTGHHSMTKGGTPAPGNIFTRSKIVQDGHGSHKIAVPVKFRAAAREFNGKIFHYIFLHCDKAIMDGELVISVCGEINDEDLDIVECNKGVIFKNTVRHLSLTPGKNIIQLRFRDNMMYSLKLEVYENR